MKFRNVKLDLTITIKQNIYHVIPIKNHFVNNKVVFS